MCWCFQSQTNLKNMYNFCTPLEWFKQQQVIIYINQERDNICWLKLNQSTKTLFTSCAISQRNTADRKKKCCATVCWCIQSQTTLNMYNLYSIKWVKQHICWVHSSLLCIAVCSKLKTWKISSFIVYSFFSPFFHFPGFSNFILNTFRLPSVRAGIAPTTTVVPHPPTQRRPTQWGGSVFWLLLFVLTFSLSDHGSSSLSILLFTLHQICSTRLRPVLFGLNLCSFCFACAFSSCCVVLPSFVFHQP